MTVEQFQKLNKVYELDLPEEQKATLYVKALTGYSDGQISQMHIKKFNKLCAKVNTAFAAKNFNFQNRNPRKYNIANGRIYRFNYDLKMPPNNAGKYIEVATYSADLINNLHLILATMATPIKWFRAVKSEAWQHEKIANDMKKLDFAVAYNAVVFFCEVSRKSIMDLQPFLVEMTAKTIPEAEANKILLGLQKTLDGFTMQKWYQNLKESV